MERIPFLSVLALVGCSGGDKDDEAGAEPLESYGCLHIAEGALVDFSTDRAAANEITLGRDPWRVNLIQDTTGYLAFETAGPADLVVLLDFARAVPAVWNGDERVEIEPGEPNPNCDADIPEVLYFSVPAGEHWLEVGPIFQGNFWMMIDEA